MSDRPLGLRPQPSTSHRVNNLREFHARMAMEPGGLKAVNQASLRRQIEARQTGAHDRTDGDDQKGGDSHDAADDDDDAAMLDATETAEDPDASVDIIKVRDEIIRMAFDATRSAGTMVDTISLLLSKENPTSAATTLSPGTRQKAGLGTLGATRLAAPTTLTQERIPQNKMMAIGRRLVDLRNAADSALAASKRLQREIGAETKYWSEVQTVTDAGFRTARLPEHQTMGVRFGFNSDKPDFADKDIAPLRRAENGSAQLVLGTYGGGSQRVQVSILENGVTVGRSSLPQPLPENSPLKDVKEASQTVFNQELWHEMNKEGRLMLDRKVRLEKSAITYPISSTQTMSIRLATLGEVDGPESESHGTKDDLAEALSIALALQLTSAHRFREEDEGENEMHNAMYMAKGEDDDEVEYLTLEPIISYFEHDKIVEQCIRLFSALVRPLSSAGLDSFVKISEKSLKQTLPPAKNRAVAATSVLLTHPEVHFNLQIAPQCRLGIKFSSSATEGTHFAVSCDPTSQPNLTNPLLERCPPYTNGYDQVSKLFEYLHDAVPRALAGYSGLILEELISSVPGDGQATKDWFYTMSNKGLVVDSGTGDYGVHFEFPVDPSIGRVVLVKGDFDENGQKISKTWSWPPKLGQDATASLEEVVKQIFAGCPPLANDTGF
ncbi:subunit 17 of mediator complex-domain-containing protein [Cladorrhinum sp. PSN332]|nr:subunit 17 of mediator complex-domain-containing protein [Cladorrhinum sp. PSN332]